MMTATAPASVPDAAQMLDVQAVAAWLSCSARHVYRLRDSGRMPPPVRIGALVRWPRRAIEEWIAAGCPAVRWTGRARP
jgi:excisionase family DNA binding protein